MKDIVIKQAGKKCQLWHGDELLQVDGRVAIKRAAKALHDKTGDPVWNWKSNNTKVEVQYAQPTNSAGCPECERSYGPHYTGPCEH